MHRTSTIFSLVAALSCLAPSHACPPIPVDAVRWTAASGGNGHWYQLVRGLLLVPEAEQLVAASGGHLVTITSPAEQAFINALLPTEATLIGLKQDPDAAEPLGGWHWVTGEPMSFVNWAPGEPNDDGAEEDCGFTWRNNDWNDGRCHGYCNGFIVEWESCNDCPGDISSDRAVNGIDLAYVLADWGSTSTRSDLNSDGAINGVDLGILLNGWGACP